MTRRQPATKIMTTPARALKTHPRKVSVPPIAASLLKRIGRLALERQTTAYAVGGCVRDWILGLPETVDIDVIIEGNGVAFAGQLAEALGAQVAQHEQFGTATLTWNSTPALDDAALRALRLDVAGCRKEIYRAPAAYPTVSAGTLRDDLLRRDFTINAMAMELQPDRWGHVIDPFGGRRDLAARRLRILHAKSFVDDPSRLLRAARFLPRFGLSLERQTAQRLRQAVAADLLRRLNRGRIRKELERMVLEPDPFACLRCLGQWLSMYGRRAR